MNRRVLSTAAATAAIILAPTAAMAYTGDDDYDATVPGSVAQGVPFRATLEGPNENALFGLRIASANVPNSAIEIRGSQELSKPTVDGVSVFEVTLHEEAVYEVTGTNAAGEVILESEIVVGDPTGDDAVADDNDGAATGKLPDTGSSTTPLAIGAAALLAAGAGVLVFARRQQA